MPSSLCGRVGRRPDTHFLGRGIVDPVIFTFEIILLAIGIAFFEDSTSFVSPDPTLYANLLCGLALQRRCRGFSRDVKFIHFFTDSRPVRDGVNLARHFSAGKLVNESSESRRDD